MDLYTITPHEFEELCYEYAELIYNQNDYKLFHTSYSHDGGKDLEINFYDELHKFKIWAECKQHKTNIGLEEIGKNVVLVIANNIDKIIFFSASKIRVSAKHEILKVGKRMNFKVQFLDDNLLIDELNKYPGLVQKYFHIEPDKNIQDITEPEINVYLTEDNQEIVNYKHDEIFYLRNGKTFFINIAIRNRTKKYFTEFSIIVGNSEDIEILEINDLENIPDEIVPLSDYLITYLCNIKSMKYQILDLPEVVIYYRQGNLIQSKTFKLPKINMTKYSVYPLTGKKYLEFLLNFDEIIIKNKANLFQLLNITGNSGCGKTRFIQEIKPKLIQKKYKYLYYDCYNFNDLNLFRKIICDLLSIPYNKKNIFYTEQQLEKILINKELSSTAAKIITKFVFQNNYSNNDISFITQYLSLLCIKSSMINGLFIAIDNIQNNNIIFFEFLYELINYFEEENNHIVFAVLLNKQRVINTNINTIKKYCDFINRKIQITPNQFMQLNFSGFDNDDIKIFWMETINRHNPNDYLIKKLIQIFGDNPLDVITAADYLKQYNILKLYQNDWIIADDFSFKQIFHSGITAFEDIFNIRFQSLLEQYPSYAENINKIISVLILFNNDIKFHNLILLCTDFTIINILRNNKIINISDDKCSFYHDSIYSFFKKDILYQYKMINEVEDFLNSDLEIEDKDVIRFNINFYKKNIKIYKTLGLNILHNYMNEFKYIEAITLGEMLYNDSFLKESDTEIYLECSYLYAFACSLCGEKDKSCGLFMEICPLFIENQEYFDSEKLCRIFRDAVNSQLQSNRFYNALEIIEQYKKIRNISKEQFFLLKNREAVTFLSLNYMKKAKIIFEESLDIANTLEENKFFYSSITYSDLALMYFYSAPSLENKEKIIENFKYAINDYNKSNDQSIYRYSEILWHKAFIKILQNEYDKALSYIDIALKDRRQNHSIYTQYRLKNLKGLCFLYKQDLKEAENCLELIKSECEINSHISATLKLCNNLGVVHVQNNNLKEAYKFFVLAFKQLDKENIYLKLYPVLSNLLIISKIMDKPTDNIMKIIKKSNDIQFIKYCEKINISNTNNIRSNKWTFWNFEGFDYIF